MSETLPHPGREPFAARLRRLREERGMSLRDLAGACELSHGAIARLESADSNPTLATLRALSRVFGVRVKSLVEGE
jgi:transcriptional regulator with XRE-family HTH domain